MKKLLFTSLILLFSNYGYATHIRSVDIQAKIINCENLEYQVIVTIEIDTGSTITFGQGEINFGDGSIINLSHDDFIKTSKVTNGLEKQIFQTSHSFSTQGTYLISFRNFNRDATILNMDRSVDTPLYAETELKVFQRYGCNSSPSFNFDPVYVAKPGQAFTHNAAAIDPDMDSLSYEVIVSKQGRDQEVINYLFPNDPKFAGTIEDGNTPAGYEINKDGTLRWNAPGETGEYTLTFRVNEWRKIGSHTLYMGSATRDMQVIVDDLSNNPPELTVSPKDTTIVSGNILQEILQAEDENPVNFQVQSAALQWRWNAIDTATLADKSFRFTWNLKDAPFDITRVPVYFQLNDNPEEDYQMATYAAWNVVIINQYNQNLALEFTKESLVNLTWEPLAEATDYEIWRKVKLPHELLIVNSEAPIADQGMEKIADVSAGTSNFQDLLETVDFINKDVCYQIIAKISAGDTIIAQKCISQDPDGLVLSTNQTGQQFQLQVYPNPFSDKIIINDLPGTIDAAKLIDLQGRSIPGLQTEGNTIYTHQVPKGLYILSIKVDSQNHQWKIVKK